MDKEEKSKPVEIDQDELFEAALSQIRKSFGVFLNMSDANLKDDEKLINEFLALVAASNAAAARNIFVDDNDAEIFFDKVYGISKKIYTSMKEEQGSNIIEGAERKEIVLDTNVEAAKNDKASRNPR